MDHPVILPPFRTQVILFSVFSVLLGLAAGLGFHHLGLMALLIATPLGVLLTQIGAWGVTAKLKAWHRITMWYAIFGLQMATSALVVILGEALLRLTFWNATFFALCVLGLLLTALELKRASTRFA